MLTYQRSNCVTFRKTKDPFGAMSNMATGYSIWIEDNLVPSSEAPYQASRFPTGPDLQSLIFSQKSPILSKRMAQSFPDLSRKDWNKVRVSTMRWCLRAKLYNSRYFHDLLMSTGGSIIVEESGKDRFWGAVPQTDEILQGHNALGRLLMALRRDIREGGQDFLE